MHVTLTPHVIPFKNGSFGLKLSQKDHETLKKKVLCLANILKIEEQKIFQSLDIISCENDHALKDVVTSENYCLIIPNITLTIDIVCSSVGNMNIIAPKYTLCSINNLNDFKNDTREKSSEEDAQSSLEEKGIFNINVVVVMLGAFVGLAYFWYQH